jgi:hypothetical protein
MDPDEVSQIHESAVGTWLQRLGKYNTDGIQKLASQYRNGDECTCVKMKNGSFNWCFKVVFDDGLAWAVRFPVAGNVMHAEEKVRRGPSSRLDLLPRRSGATIAYGRRYPHA